MCPWIYKKLTEHQIDWIKKIPSPYNNQNTKTLNIQNKERILRTAKEKGQETYKGRPIRITPDFSIERMKTRGLWSGES